MIEFSTILDFWYRELSPRDWFKKNAEVDATITRRFSQAHALAAQGELFGWRRQPLGRLAEILVLDQFSRNMYRDSPRAFAYDGMALILAQEAIATDADRVLEPGERQFLYMPFMHSESLRIHETALQLFAQPGLEDALRSEQQHQQIIARFGRYPHRNNLLGRQSTADEIEFLQQPGASF